MLGSWVRTGYRIRDGRPTALATGCKRTLVFAAAVALLPGHAWAQTPAKVLHVSVSSALAPVMPAIAQNYERASGVKLVVTSGPSGKQVAAIEAGEPADLFLGSDFTYPEKLVADGLTDAKAPVAYAKNALVLFALKSSPLQPISLETLQNEHLQTLAIPDGLHAPTGRAARAALTRMKALDRISPKLVQTEDVTEAADLVLAGKAQLAFLPQTLAQSNPYHHQGTFILVPESQYPELKEYAVVLKKGNVSEAHHLLDWLLSPEIQTKLPNIGLEAVR